MSKNCKDDLGDRMKTYERVPKNYLMRRQPVILRVDGKSFHTFTKGFNKPFDEILVKTMQDTMKYLCENIQGAVLGYTQSDEITVLLTDYKALNTAAWFDYNVQKCCSIAASMATMAFNKFFGDNIVEWFDNSDIKFAVTEEDVYRNKELARYYDIVTSALRKGAMFDARVFNVPFEEVTNCFLWRQLDAKRNSVQMLGRYYFTHRELQNASCEDIKEMLLKYDNVDWNELPTHLKWGSCCIKKSHCEDDCIDECENISRPHWEIDLDIPLFIDDGRDYVERQIYFQT